MNILQAKNEIKNTVQAYLSKNSFGEYEIESKNQRPLLLIGPPGIGKTQIMEQISKECQIGLVSYTITHHTRQSAVGLPFIQEKEFQGKTYNDSLECPGDSKKLKPTKSAKKEKRYETRLRHQRQTVFRQELSVRVPADDRHYGGDVARSHSRNCRRA